MQQAVQENFGNVEPLFAGGGANLISKSKDNNIEPDIEEIEPDIEPDLDPAYNSKSPEITADSPSLDSEISAMLSMIGIMEPLDNTERKRVLQWAADRFLPVSWNQKLL